MSQETGMMIVAFLGALLVAAIPVIQVYKNWTSSRADAKVSEAEGNLYQHLAEQLKLNAEALNQAYTERNDMIHRYAGIEVRMKLLEEREAQSQNLVTTLSRKLDERENEIRSLVAKNEALVNEVTQKNNTIHDQNQKIAELTERMHQLELRVAVDEARWPQG